MIEVLGRVGFVDVELRERFDAFRGTSKEEIARKFGVMGVNVFAKKP
jgi:hypothetical protein